MESPDNSGPFMHWGYLAYWHPTHQSGPPNSWHTRAPLSVDRSETAQPQSPEYSGFQSAPRIQYCSWHNPHSGYTPERQV